MKMNEIAIVGGDLRLVELAKLYQKDGKSIYTYGLEKSEQLNKMQSIKKCKTLEEAIKNCKIVVGPIPLSKDNEYINAIYTDKKISIKNLIEKLEDKILIAGNIENNKQFFKINSIDILKRSELSILNAISTAEGTIQIIMENTIKTINESKILIMGFGKIGKVLANKLKLLGAKVYCEARKEEDFAWIRAYGYEIVKLRDLNKQLHKFDVIINTIPYLILNRENIGYIKKESIIIDLASMPGGIDREEIKRNNLQFIHALGLPGRVAPMTSAEFIKETIENIFNEIEK